MVAQCAKVADLSHDASAVTAEYHRSAVARARIIMMVTTRWLKTTKRRPLVKGRSFYMVWSVEVGFEKVRCFEPNTVATVDPTIADIVRSLITVDLVEEFPVNGTQKEFCIRRMERLGVLCLGYSVRYEGGEWGVSACRDWSGKYLTVHIGPIVRKIRGACKWSFAAVAKSASPAELVERLNKILLCVAKSL